MEDKQLWLSEYNGPHGWRGQEKKLSSSVLYKAEMQCLTSLCSNCSSHCATLEGTNFNPSEDLDI